MPQPATPAQVLPEATPLMWATAYRARAGRIGQWERQVARLGGCTNPIRLAGTRTAIDTGTGEMSLYSTADEPDGVLLRPCGNRRASRCLSCSETYRADTWHLINSGLVGAKGVPETVRAHPRVFVTLTAPSFGKVHNRPDAGRCACGVRHRDDDPSLGSPLDAAGYDYAGAVLWQAHASQLWHRFTIAVLRRIAALTGHQVTALRRRVRVSFAKVAEYQKRGLVHFHAVVRLDGADGPDDLLPDWATVRLLARAVRHAARSVRVNSLPVDGFPVRALGFGRQCDIRPIATRDGASGELTERAVAAYIAKYATKGAEASGTLDRRIVTLRQVVGRAVTPHARRMILMCWRLGRFEEYRYLRRWAHMLGYRGHFATKSRRYSTTLTALRRARDDFRRRLAAERTGRPALAFADCDGPEIEVTRAFAFAGLGFRSSSDALLAAHLTRTRSMSPEPHETEGVNDHG